MSTLVLPREIVNRILGHAQEGGDVAGLIGAVGGAARHVYRLTGTDPAQDTGGGQHALEVAPARREAVLARLAERGEGILGVYHAHPQGGAEPRWHHLSPAVRALLPADAYWLVVSLGTRGVLEMRAFRGTGPGALVETALSLED